MTQHRPQARTPGFTLIELILSLTILAAVASIVLTSAANIVERRRYEETEHRGETARLPSSARRTSPAGSPPIWGAIR
jgi:prepilin-type N-terminal cleavage/methylation domain-containing protein